MHLQLKKNIIPIAMLIVMGFFFSCKENKMEVVQEITEENTGPSQVTWNGKYVFTDSGRVKNILEAGLLEQYANDSDYVRVNDKFRLRIFNKAEQQTAQLSADSGFYFEKQARMEAHGNVIFSNTDQDTLFTEMLIWYNDSDLIFTDSLIDIVRPDGHIMGKGLRSNQAFSKYTILKPKGNLEFKEEEEE